MSVMVPVRVEIPLSDGTFALTNTFQLLQWKHAIGLEMLGLKMSRGSVNAHVKRILKLPKNTKRKDVQAYVAYCLDSVMEQME